MDHGGMDHGHMDHGDMDMGQCSMNVSMQKSCTSLTLLIMIDDIHLGLQQPMCHL